MNKVYKSVLVAATAAIVAGATLTPVAVNAQGDSAGGRQVYTLEQINQGYLGNGITLNSITNGKIGDERNFVGAKLTSDPNNIWHANQITVKDGETYTIRLYVHNNSPLGTSAIAENVSVNYSIPTTVAKSHTITGYINASNATPTRYWDEVDLVSDGDFYLEYVENSARYTNGKLGTVNLPNEVVTSGAKVGYDAMDGRLPGCYDYDGQATIQVKVHSAVQKDTGATINTKLSLKVKMKGADKWEESVNAKVGDEVEYQIEYVNLSSETMEDVIISDVLPTNVEYVKGTTKLFNEDHQDGMNVAEDTVISTGLIIGRYAPHGNAYVQFTGRVVNNTLACDKNNQLVNLASATVKDNKVFKDDASVMVQGAQCSKENPNSNPDKDSTPVVDNPTQIVSTGPAEVAGAALGAGSIITALGYFIASRRKF